MIRRVDGALSIMRTRKSRPCSPGSIWSQTTTSNRRAATHFSASAAEVAVWISQVFPSSWPIISSCTGSSSTTRTTGRPCVVDPWPAISSTFLAAVRAGRLLHHLDEFGKRNGLEQARCGIDDPEACRCDRKLRESKSQPGSDGGPWRSNPGSFQRCCLRSGDGCRDPLLLWSPLWHPHGN